MKELAHELIASGFYEDTAHVSNSLSETSLHSAILGKREGVFESVLDAAKIFGLAGEEGVYREISLKEAESIITSLCEKSLAYGVTMLSKEKAERLTASFLQHFAVSERLQFYTNMWLKDKDISSWSSATSATFDAGVLVLGNGSCGVFWVTDED